VKTFLERFVPDRHVGVPGNLMKVLKQHFWPGNVRELENLMERMTILRRSDELTLDDLPADFGMTETAEGKTDPIESKEHVTFYEAEKRLIIGALEKFGWNRTKAAVYLSIPRHILIYRMKKFGIYHDETV
jgi:two-component system NtrC family response regulator